MDILTVLILLALFIYIINVIPFLMPPTWTILAFFYINYHPPFIPVIVLGAGAATLGRITLYYLSKRYFRRFFSQKSLKNYDVLGKFVTKNEKFSIPIFITYAFFPISSNYVYIAAGLAKINIKILASSFFVGRLISYSFWVAASHYAVSRVEDIFTSHINNIGVIAVELIGFIIVILIGKINWGKILKIPA